MRKTAAERQAEILGAAEAIARESGLSAITMRAVGTRIGITPTLVVHHVASMDQLVADTFTRIVQRELDEVSDFSASVPSAADQLEPTLATLLEGSRSEVTLVWVEAWALGRSNEPLADAVREQMDGWREFFASLIRAGVESGIYRVTDPLAVAGQLLGMVDGLNAHSLVGWQDDANRTELLLRAARAMLVA